MSAKEKETSRNGLCNGFFLQYDYSVRRVDQYRHWNFTKLESLKSTTNEWYNRTEKNVNNESVLKETIMWTVCIVITIAHRISRSSSPLQTLCPKICSFAEPWCESRHTASRKQINYYVYEVASPMAREIEYRVGDTLLLTLIAVQDRLSNYLYSLFWGRICIDSV